MKIFATLMLMISLVCGSLAMSATDVQAHRAARPHRHVIIWERPGARHHRHAVDRHAVVRHRHHVREAARARHHRRAEARHHAARGCKTVFSHGAWVKRC